MCIFKYLMIYYKLMYKNELSLHVQIVVSNAIFQWKKHLKEMANSRNGPEIIQEEPGDFMVQKCQKVLKNPTISSIRQRDTEAN